MVCRKSWGTYSCWIKPLYKTINKIINNVDLARIRRFRKWVLGAETPTTVDRPGYRYGLVMNCSSCSILHPVFVLKKEVIT